MTELASFLRMYWPDWLSMLSGLMLLTIPSRAVWPKTLWGWLLASNLVLIPGTLGMLPVDVNGYGYVHGSWLKLIGPALWVGITVCIAASRSLWLGVLALIPAVFWRLGWSPAPELWRSYLDAPLTLVALYQVIRHTLRPKGRKETPRRVLGTEHGAPAGNLFK